MVITILQTALIIEAIVISDYGMYQFYDFDESNLYKHVLRQVDAANQELNQINVTLLLKDVIILKTREHELKPMDLDHQKNVITRWAKICTGHIEKEKIRTRRSMLPCAVESPSYDYYDPRSFEIHANNEFIEEYVDYNCYEQFPQFDVAIIFSGYDYNKTEVGWSYRGTVCKFPSSDNSTGSIVVDGKASKHRAYITISHEIGHLIGLQHDDHCPGVDDTRKNIMAPATDFTQSGWSDCTIDQLLNITSPRSLSRIFDWSCLSKNATSDKSVIDVTTERGQWPLIWIHEHWIFLSYVFLTMIFYGSMYICYRRGEFKKVRELLKRLKR